MRRGTYVDFALAVRGRPNGWVTTRWIRAEPARALRDLKFCLLCELVSVALGHRARVTQVARQPAEAARATVSFCRTSPNYQNGR